MTSKLKSVLFYSGITVAVCLLTLSIPAAMILPIFFPNYSVPFVVIFALVIAGLIICAALIEKNERKKPRKVPTHQLSENMSRPPSHDAVTIPANKELWHVPLYVIPIVATPLLVLGYKFGTSPYIDWFPVIICLMVLVYMYEAIRGPLRRWWIANVFGEWSGKKWSVAKNAKVVYWIDTSNAWQADTQRLFSFFGGPILFSRFWLEVYVPEIKVVGYLKISRAKFYELTKSNCKYCSIKYRRSKLHPDRLQLKLE